MLKMYPVVLEVRLEADVWTPAEFCGDVRPNDFRCATQRSPDRRLHAGHDGFKQRDRTSYKWDMSAFRANADNG